MFEWFASACSEQIVYADLLVLNKTDRVGASILGRVESRLRTFNPVAPVLRADHGRVEPQEIFGLGSRLMAPKASVASGDEDGEHEHEHDEGIGAVAVEMRGDVNLDVLDLWLGTLARSKRPLVLRMKGVLAIAGYSERFVFQGVRTTVDVHPDRPWRDEARTCRIVFIGRGLDESALVAGFRRCMHA